MEKLTFFIDIDGTIFTPKFGKVTDRVRESIERLNQEGHQCFIATGRPYSFISDEIKALPFDGYIASRGAHVVMNGKTVKTEYMDRGKVEKLIERLKQKGMEYVLFDEEHSYLPRTNRKFLEAYESEEKNNGNLVFDYNENEILDRLLKLEVWQDNADEREFLRENLNGLKMGGDPNGKRVDIYEENMSKGHAVKEIIEELELDRDKTYCFGDTGADLEMFSYVGHPIAMGNASRKIKNVSESICPSVFKDGVAVAIDEILK